MTRRPLALLGATLVALASVALFGTPATATENTAVIRKVDTTGAPTVKLTVLPPSRAPGDAEVRLSENGRAITNKQVERIVDTTTPIGTVLAIDTSSDMNDGAAIDKVRFAAKAMVATKASNEKMAIVAFNSGARPVVSLTDDVNLLNSGIDSLLASNDAALWSGIDFSAALLQAAPELQPNIIVISGAPDEASPSGAFTQARLRVRETNAVVMPVIVQQQVKVESDGLLELANTSGGRVVQTTDAGTLTQILLGLHQNLLDQKVVTYQSLGGDALDIQVQIGSGIGTANTSVGTVSEGAQVNKVQISQPGPSFLSGTFGMVLVGVLTLGFVGLLLYGLIEIASKERNQLKRALRPYSDDVEDESRDFSRIADSEIIRRAVASTAKLADDRGLLAIVENRLALAALPLRPAEALFFTGVIAFVAMIVGLVAFGPIGLILAGVVFAYMPILVTNVLAMHRRRKFTSQLPDTLQLLSGSLRAGYSLMQGLDAVAKQSADPMATELQRALSEARLGRPIEEALQDIADRVGSDDFKWAVMAIKIQREVGGNLAEVLSTVSETMIARERLRREVRALTAEGRISAIVLSVLPPIIGAVIMVLNPTYMEPMLNSTLGQYVLVGSGFSIGIGYWLMTKMIQIEA